MEDAQGLLQKAATATAAQESLALAAAGAGGAAQTVAENAQLGAEPLNPLIEGDIDLGEQEMFADEMASLEADQDLLDQDILPSDEEDMEAEV